jgi:hypothetical protein
MLFLDKSEELIAIPTSSVAFAGGGAPKAPLHQNSSPSLVLCHASTAKQRGDDAPDREQKTKKAANI